MSRYPATYCTTSPLPPSIVHTHSHAISDVDVDAGVQWLPDSALTPPLPPQAPTPPRLLNTTAEATVGAKATTGSTSMSDGSKQELTRRFHRSRSPPLSGGGRSSKAEVWPTEADGIAPEMKVTTTDAAAEAPVTISSGEYGHQYFDARSEEEHSGGSGDDGSGFGRHPRRPLAGEEEYYGSVGVGTGAGAGSFTPALMGTTSTATTKRRSPSPVFGSGEWAAAGGGGGQFPSSFFKGVGSACHHPTAYGGPIPMTPDAAQDDSNPQRDYSTPSQGEFASMRNNSAFLLEMDSDVVDAGTAADGAPALSMQDLFLGKSSSAAHLRGGGDGDGGAGSGHWGAEGAGGGLEEESPSRMRERAARTKLMRKVRTHGHLLGKRRMMNWDDEHGYQTYIMSSNREDE